MCSSLTSWQRSDSEAVHGVVLSMHSAGRQPVLTAQTAPQGLQCSGAPRRLPARRLWLGPAGSGRRPRPPEVVCRGAHYCLASADYVCLHCLVVATMTFQVGLLPFGHPVEWRVLVVRNLPY